jgi:hypothetical protein
MPRAHPAPMTEPVPERRVINRVHTAVPVTINIIGGAAPVTVQTSNISPRGMSTLITIRMRERNGRVSIHEETKGSARLVKHLLSKDRIVGLGFRIMPQGGSIDAMGTVKWYASRVSKRSYAVRVGIFLDEIDRAHRHEWFSFLRAIYEHLACFYKELDDARGPVTPV